jgi:hypothetical protein
LKVDGLSITVIDMFHAAGLGCPARVLRHSCIVQNTLRRMGQTWSMNIHLPSWHPIYCDVHHVH